MNNAITERTKMSNSAKDVEELTKEGYVKLTFEEADLYKDKCWFKKEAFKVIEFDKFHIGWFIPKKYL